MGINTVPSGPLLLCSANSLSRQTARCRSNFLSFSCWTIAGYRRDILVRTTRRTKSSNIPHSHGELLSFIVYKTSKEFSAAFSPGFHTPLTHLSTSQILDRKWTLSLPSSPSSLRPTLMTPPLFPPTRRGGAPAETRTASSLESTTRARIIPCMPYDQFVS